MINANFGDRRADMFVAGSDEHARISVAELATQIGLEDISLGGLDMARHLESIAWVWIHAALKARVLPRHAAFGVLKR